ncbi:MAG: hypothetical protein ACRD9L_14095 [Bryobacteraceae bacterium]
MNPEDKITAIYMVDPDRRLRACDYLPRFNTWLCGVCHRGTVDSWLTACPHCKAAVVKVETEDE